MKMEIMAQDDVRLWLFVSNDDETIDTGCIWVYGGYNLCSDEPSLLSYCDKVIYWFSFWLIIGAVIVTLMLFVFTFILFFCSMIRQIDDLDMPD